MKHNDADPAQDIWKEWLLNRRFRGDRALMQSALDDFLYPIRNRVLEHAALQGHETLLDVGCGDGLIGFGALERLSTGRVIFSDISQDLLDHVAAIARQMGLTERSAFLRASVDDLSALNDASVDVVTTRSVLIYVADKPAAFAEFYRVLKPGGRVSLFEPINRFAHPEPRHLFLGFDVTPIMDITDKVNAVFDALQPATTDPMLDFDERDLFAMAESAGFDEVHLELKLEVKADPQLRTWDNLMHIPGNPKIPSVAEAMDTALDAEEKERLIAHLRPLVEAGEGKARSALAYLWAVKSERVSPREDWEEQFQAMHTRGDDSLVDEDLPATTWDEEEWDGI